MCLSVLPTDYPHVTHIKLWITERLFQFHMYGKLRVVTPTHHTIQFPLTIEQNTAFNRRQISNEEPIT